MLRPFERKTPFFDKIGSRPAQRREEPSSPSPTRPPETNYRDVFDLPYKREDGTPAKMLIRRSSPERGARRRRIGFEDHGDFRSRTPASVEEYVKEQERQRRAASVERARRLDAIALAQAQQRHDLSAVLDRYTSADGDVDFETYHAGEEINLPTIREEDEELDSPTRKDALEARPSPSVLRHEAATRSQAEYDTFPAPEIDFDEVGKDGIDYDQAYDLNRWDQLRTLGEDPEVANRSLSRNLYEARSAMRGALADKEVDFPTMVTGMAKIGKDFERNRAREREQRMETEQANFNQRPERVPEAIRPTERTVESTRNTAIEAKRHELLLQKEALKAAMEKTDQLEEEFRGATGVDLTSLQVGSAGLLDKLVVLGHNVLHRLKGDVSHSPGAKRSEHQQFSNHATEISANISRLEDELRVLERTEEEARAARRDAFAYRPGMRSSRLDGNDVRLTYAREARREWEKDAYHREPSMPPQAAPVSEASPSTPARPPFESIETLLNDPKNWSGEPLPTSQHEAVATDRYGQHRIEDLNTRFDSMTHPLSTQDEPGRWGDIFNGQSRSSRRKEAAEAQGRSIPMATDMAFDPAGNMIEDGNTRFSLASNGPSGAWGQGFERNRAAGRVRIRTEARVPKQEAASAETSPLTRAERASAAGTREPLTATERAMIDDGNFGDVPEIMKAYFKAAGQLERFERSLSALPILLNRVSEDPMTAFGSLYWRLNGVSLEDAKKYITEAVKAGMGYDPKDYPGQSPERLAEAACTLYESIRPHVLRHPSGEKDEYITEYVPGLDLLNIARHENEFPLGQGQGDRRAAA